jgi:hypothetical protein
VGKEILRVADLGNVRQYRFQQVKGRMLAFGGRVRSALTIMPASAFMLLSAAGAFVSTPVAAQEAARILWTTSVQTGFSDTFQLTLGVTFGDGPAWQNRVTTGLSNAFRTGDSIFIYGWNTLDTPSHSNNWQAGLGYKMRVLKKRNHSLNVGSGLQHWYFPTVKTGTNDWLIPGSLVYETKIRHVPLTVTNDSWTLLASPLPTGSLLHVQAWLQHNVFKRERVQVAFKHGPAYTYSWNFYGVNGNRVLRYQTMLAIAREGTSIEGGYRKQWGLQPGIPNNTYWQFALTRAFTLGRRE